MGTHVGAVEASCNVQQSVVHADRVIAPRRPHARHFFPYASSCIPFLHSGQHLKTCVQQPVSRCSVSVSVSCNASVQRECAQLCARHLRAKHFGKLLEEECGLGLLEEDCGLGLLERLWFRAWEEDCRALGAHTKLAASVCVCAYGMHAVCACTWKRESSKTSNHADCQRRAATSLLAQRRRAPRGGAAAGGPAANPPKHAA